MDPKIRNRKDCLQCKKSFIITDQDWGFYQKMAVLEPTLCPVCRARRRLAFRNERTFYKDACAQCKKTIVSQFSPLRGLIVYCESCYWKDSWEGQEYGRDFDFSKTFGEQFDALNRAVPHMAMIHTNSENCEYTHLAANNKNSYMLIESSDNESCIHSYWLQKCRDCIDTSYAHESEKMYNCDDCVNCYALQYCRNCSKCTDSYFLLNCRDCTNCYGCVNLSHKEYCVFNEQKTKEEYKQFIASKKLTIWNGVCAAHEEFEKFSIGYPRKYAYSQNAEGCAGNYLRNAKNCLRAFHAYDCENCTYAEHVWRNAKDCMDVSTVGIDAQLVYDSINTALGVYMMRCTNQCWNGSNNCDFCFFCGGLSYGFGCVAIKKGDHCILNKKYSQEEYDTLREKIITHMKETGEWGHFLDPKYSLFGYNETIAQEEYPLEKEAAVMAGFQWQDLISGSRGKETIMSASLPESIADIPDTITKEVLACVQCHKNYNIISQELKFYRANSIPLPQLCPDCRHSRRIAFRGPNELWSRQCMCDKNGHEHAGKCPAQFETTYSPDRPEIIYCGFCYQKEVE